MSAATARRIALGAQGFAEPRPAGVPTRRHLAKVLGRTRLLQLDSVNVAVRAHYAPVFSRLGAYPMELLSEAAWSHSARRPRMLVEYWAHEASLLPVEDWPLLEWRRERFRTAPGRYWQTAVSNPALAGEVLAAVKELGPISAGALERELGLQAERGRGSWWNRSEVKRLCEWLFAGGELTTGTRRGFERLYELTERVLPPAVLAAPPVPHDDAVRALTGQAAAALGVATEPDLRDYYRLKPEASQRAVAELVESGELEPVAVRGWAAPAYRHRSAKAPRRIGAAALLCPFDPVVWRRERTERLFGFHYRIEIYVPEPKRQYGYYVFPFLLGDELVARVDLKADRATGTLRVPAAHAEPGTDHAAVAEPLAAELRTMAGWLGLEQVAIAPKGDLAPTLRRHFT
jgi:uncharacterized protein